MRTALIGGIITGLFIKGGWIGVFSFPVVVAIYQCIELFIMKGRNPVYLKKFTSPYAKIRYDIEASPWTKFIDSKKIYLSQFIWTYSTTTIVAVLVYVLYHIILKN